jgi:hypothetical protein
MRIYRGNRIKAIDHTRWAGFLKDEWIEEPVSAQRWT